MFVNRVVICTDAAVINSLKPDSEHANFLVAMTDVMYHNYDAILKLCYDNVLIIAS